MDSSRSLLDRHAHELDPLELIVRAYQHWEHHRWPGRNGRLAYARSLYSVFILRQLEHLSLRIWDDGNDRAADRLQEIQRLLDRLNDAAGSNVFVRDARWLIQTAQGPLTRHLRPYFRIAEQIAGSFTDAQRPRASQGGRQAGRRPSPLATALPRRGRRASRSTIRTFSPITRNSNSMDAALLVRDLVPLLEAYQTALAPDATRKGGWIWRTPSSRAFRRTPSCFSRGWIFWLPAR